MIDNPITRKYWNISDVAKITHVTASAIRFFEKKFDWIKPVKITNKRQYDLEGMASIMQVVILRKLGGITVEGIQKAHKMGYINELQDFIISKQRNYRPEACKLTDLNKFPYTYLQATKL